MPNNVKQKNAWVWLWLSFSVILIDQLSKHIADHLLHYARPVFVLPFFNLWLKYNAGAAFSFFGNGSGWQVFLLSGISILVIVFIFAWMTRVKRSDWLMACALSLIMGGATGNLIDRIRFGYVIDFFDFHIGTWHFATFNVADSAISVGATFLVIKLLFFSKK
jgi:signal peptidase II